MCVCVHALSMICLVYFHLLLKEKFFLFLFIVHLFLTFNVGSIAFIPFWLTCAAKVSLCTDPPSSCLSVRPCKTLTLDFSQRLWTAETLYLAFTCGNLVTRPFRNLVLIDLPWRSRSQELVEGSKTANFDLKSTAEKVKTASAQTLHNSYC